MLTSSHEELSSDSSSRVPIRFDSAPLYLRLGLLSALEPYHKLEVVSVRVLEINGYVAAVAAYEDGNIMRLEVLNPGIEVLESNTIRMVLAKGPWFRMLLFVC